MKKIILIVAAALTLSACNTTQRPDLIVEGLRLPALSDDDLTCPDSFDDDPTDLPVPTPRPGEPKIRESVAQQYIANLRRDGRICASKMNVVRPIWRATEQRQEAVSRAIRPNEEGK